MRRPVFLLLTVLLFTIFSSISVAQTTITVYHRDELREIEWMAQVKEAFEAANPDIKVELIQGVGGGGSGYAERLAVLFASGNPPDVFYGSTDKAGFILNGWARDITDLIERDRQAMNLDEFFPGIFEAATRKGRIYGVPAIAMAQAIFYNPQLFAEAGLAPPPVDWDDPGWNWDEFVEYAKKLTKSNPDGTLLQAGINEVLLIDLPRMFGGDWFPPEAYDTGIATRTTLLDPAVERAYSEAQRLYSELRAAAASPNSGLDPWSGFWSGMVAMEWTGWWKIRNYLDAIDFEWAIAPVPRAVSRANTRFTDPWFISTTAKDVEAAWRFVKFVTSVEGLDSFARYVAFPPSRQTALDAYIETVSNASGMPPGQVLIALGGALEHSVVAYDESIGGAAQWNPIMTEELIPALRGERPVRQALENAQTRVDAVLSELASRWSP